MSQMAPHWTGWPEALPRSFPISSPPAAIALGILPFVPNSGVITSSPKRPREEALLEERIAPKRARLVAKTEVIPQPPAVSTNPKPKNTAKTAGKGEGMVPAPADENRYRPKQTAAGLRWSNPDDPKSTPSPPFPSP